MQHRTRPVRNMLGRTVGHALHGTALFVAAQQERGRHVDIVVYGREGTALTDMIRDTAAMQYRLLHFLTPESYDAYLAALRSSVPEIICIAVPGAVGMEAAIAAHELCPKASLVWFAEDAAFGAQSYRVDCRYFTAEPVNGAWLQRQSGIAVLFPAMQTQSFRR